MDTDDSDCRPHTLLKKQWSRWKTRMMTKMRICDRWREYFAIIFPLSIHGTRTVFGQRKRGCVLHTCLHDESIIGNQASKRCIVRAGLSMEIGRWVFSVFFIMPLSEGTVLYDCMAFYKFPRGR